VAAGMTIRRFGRDRMVVDGIFVPDWSAMGFQRDIFGGQFQKG